MFVRVACSLIVGAGVVSAAATNHVQTEEQHHVEILLRSRTGGAVARLCVVLSRECMAHTERLHARCDHIWVQDDRLSIKE